MARPITTRLLLRQHRSSKRAEKTYVAKLGDDHLLALKRLLSDGAAAIPNFSRVISKIARGVAADKLLDKVPHEPLDVIERRSMPYADFLETEYWASVREAVFRAHGKQCLFCGSKSRIQVHHTTYDHRGDELNHIKDLIPLCKRCHTDLHSE